MVFFYAMGVNGVAFLASSNFTVQGNEREGNAVP
jgi:hypothetical protein